jgi:hypothetical protein
MSSLGSGDFNGDGRDDLVIGMQFSAGGRGRAYVVMGRPSWPAFVDLEVSSPDILVITGSSECDGSPPCASLGMSSRGCDFDGDGIDELALSAGGMEYGEIYLFRGSPVFAGNYSMGNVYPNVVRIIDEDLHRLTGESLDCADIDGDGREDLVIGSPGNTFDMYDGVVAVLYGEPSPPDTITIGAPAHRVKRVYGQYAHGALGWRVTARDVDSDGKVDLATSAYLGDPGGCVDCGEVYVIGSADELPASSSIAEAATTRILGTARDTNNGVGMAVGDFTGDRLGDIAVAGRSWTGAVSDRDTVIIAYGNLAETPRIVASSDTLVSRVISHRRNDQLGVAMVVADFNPDGMDDLVLGAPSWDYGAATDAGKVYILFGQATGSSVVRHGSPTLRVSAATPNPFVSSTRIFYSTDAMTPAVGVFDVRGRVVRRMSRVTASVPGVFSWDGTDDEGHAVPSGVYFIRFEIKGQSQARKVTVAR